MSVAPQLASLKTACQQRLLHSQRPATGALMLGLVAVTGDASDGEGNSSRTHAPVTNA